MLINDIEQCKKKKKGKKKFSIKSEMYCKGEKRQEKKTKAVEVFVMLGDLGQNSSVVETETAACSDMSSKQEKPPPSVVIIILPPPGRRNDLSDQLVREGNAELLSECASYLIYQIKLTSASCRSGSIAVT